MTSTLTGDPLGAWHGNSVSVSVHLTDPAGLRFVAFPPEAGSEPFVSLKVDPVGSLLVADVRVLEALAVQVAAAREALLTMQSGQDPLPLVDADRLPLPAAPTVLVLT